MHKRQAYFSDEVRGDAREKVKVRAVSAPWFFHPMEKKEEASDATLVEGLRLRLQERSVNQFRLL